MLERQRKYSKQEAITRFSRNTSVRKPVSEFDGTRSFAVVHLENRHEAQEVPRVGNLEIVIKNQADNTKVCDYVVLLMQEEVC